MTDSLSKMLRQEESFHESWAKSINVAEVLVDEFFEACTAPENRMILGKLGDLRGKKILELGCGAGEASVYFAKKGADVTATDLSAGMLRVVEKLAERHAVSVATKQNASDHLDFPDGSFDIVYASNLLHHVDIEPTLAEARRVLKSGGIFASWDPLVHNPVIKVYRRMAMKVRTKGEHPLSMGDLRIFRRYFSRVDYDTTWLTTLWIFMKFYLIDRVHPDQERYWKKILLEHKALAPLYGRLARIDAVLLKALPFLRRYCWNIVVCARK